MCFQSVKTDEYGRVIDERASANDVGIFGLATQIPRFTKIRNCTLLWRIIWCRNSEGKLTLTADFGDKKVNGSITEESYYLITKHYLLLTYYLPLSVKPSLLVKKYICRHCSSQRRR